ncbi:MAG: hypothetical protein KDD37_02235 [Bdellovibrionales bacterium]|nr:hypothetical protein [Bdellovibrionales bacterium]
MWWKQGQRLTRLYTFKHRRFQLIDSKFQWKYTLVLAGGVGVFSLFAYSVAWYFIEQNYKIFIDYAYAHSPNFVSNLEFERRWIQNILAGSLLGLNIFVVFTTLKILNSILFPLQVMKRHLLHLTKGDWSQPEVKVRAGDDYTELVDAYNYFYKALQRQSMSELNKMMSLEISKNAHRSRDLWKHLVEYKYEQLNGSSLEFEKSHDPHLAS